jgi:hypothetical protein
MSDSYSIQEVGGAELALHFHDRGIIAESDHHRAILIAGQRASGWRRLFKKSERFIAVLSANSEGLRMFVALDNFAVFIPWSAMTVSAERSSPGTLVRLETAAVSSVNLKFYLDDDAADALFSPVMAPLPRRNPPERLYWMKPWALGLLVATMLATATLLALLKLSWLDNVIAVGVIAVALSLLRAILRPILEDPPKKARHRSTSPGRR